MNLNHCYICSILKTFFMKWLLFKDKFFDVFCESMHLLIKQEMYVTGSRELKWSDVTFTLIWESHDK